MTITLQVTPEIEAQLARRATLSGRAVEDVASEVFENAMRPPRKGLPPVEPGFGRRVVEAFGQMSGMLTDEEIDTIFARQPGTDRPVEL